MPKYISLDTKEIGYLYIEQNKTYNEIAEIFGVSVPTIKRRLRTDKIKRRPKYNLLDNVFAHKTEDSSYWAGFMAADGCVSEGHKKKIRIELKYDDESHLHKFCDFFDRERNSVKICKRTKWGKEYKSAVLEIGNANIVKGLVDNFNVIQAKSLILQPPELYLEQNIKSYILGYFDGDGHIGINGNLILFNITSGSEYIMNWFKDKIANFVNINLPLYHKDNVYRLTTSGEKAWAILDWLYKDSTEQTRLNRKYERYEKYKMKKQAS